MDAPVAPRQPVRLAQEAGRWVLLATILGSSVAMLDATVVNVALPAIGRDLGTGLAGLQWTINAYTLTLAGLILLGGSLGDAYGRRRVFVVGLVWFGAASLMCGLAPDVGWLIVARLLQGVGGALLTPGSLALIQASFARDERARAVGAWSGFSGVAAAVGPFLGGWLVDSWGWRWIFLINLPLVVLVIFVSLRHVPESSSGAPPQRFDVTGAALAATALGGVTYALIEGAEPGSRAPALAAGALGAVAAVLFVLVERRRRHPLLPLDIFSSRQFSSVNVVTLAVYAALSGIFFLLVVQLQVVSGFSAVAAGTGLIPVTLLMLALSPGAGSLAQRIGPRWPMTAGPLVSAVGVLLMRRIGPDASYLTDVLPAAAVFGLGLSLTVAPLTATVLATASVRRAGVASGVNNAVARAAGLLAVAGLPALVGLSGADYRVPRLLDAGFDAAMLVCAGLLVAGGLLALVTIRDDALSAAEEPAEPEEAGERRPRPRGRRHCAIDAPPLEPGDRP